MRHLQHNLLLASRGSPKFFFVMETLTIRLIDDLAGFAAVEDLQRAVWGMPDLDVVPLHHLRAASAAGGVVLGAFAPDGMLAGFSYAFVGMRDGAPLLYSHMTGVRNEFRGRGGGLALKRAQREHALARGFDRIVWTFDPLQRVNAYFNHHALGAVCSRYLVNYYGTMRDAINRGTDSDRLEVDWWIREPAVEARFRDEPLPARAALHPSDARGAGPTERIEIPEDFDTVRAADPDRAPAVRIAVRERFRDAFGRGYEVFDFTDSAYHLRVRPAPHADR